MARVRGDVVGFRRIFVLFMTLILVPAVLLSGFGVIAIVNESGAEAARRRRAAESLLRDAQARLLRALERATPLATALPSDAIPDRALQAARELEPGGQAFVSVAGGVAAIRREGELVTARVLSDAQVRGLLDGLVEIEDDMSLDLRVVNAPELLESGAIDRLVRELARDEDDDLIRARAQLEPPLERYQLVVTSTAGGATTARVVYIVLLVLFYTLLIVGVVLTSRLIWQETRLSRLKTDFVSHVSHELRTPLTSIRMFIETLRMGRASSPAEQEECLELLTKETERLSEMIERVLGYARLRAGRRQFAVAPVAPAALVDDALAAFRAQNLNLGALELVRDVEDALPPVLVDREAMAEALLNLVGNAYKYAGEANYIRVFARAGKRGRVELGVEDRGPGLAKSEHKRIFERFYQSGQLLARAAKGSGLGLAITKGIVEGQGGRIRVESALGEGATFLLELRTGARVESHG